MFKALLGASRTTTMKRGALPGGNGRRRASSFALGVAAALLTLAACAAVDRPIAAATAGRTAVVVPIPPAVAVKLPPAVAMVPPPPIEPAAVATDAVIIPAATAAAAAAVDPGLARLQGLRRAELADLLGTPDFVRRDPPAELWQYRGVECVLDLFLYRKAAGDEYRVEHAESHDRFTSREAKSGCAAALVQQRKLSAPQTAAARL